MRAADACTEVVVVLVTVPDADCGERLARTFVERRLAACVNRLGPLRSIYRFDGKVESAEEHLLVIKPSRARVDALRDAVVELHPYGVPEFAVIPVVAGLSTYLDWVAAETSG
jgi:periplasmic divalent cation tolerance protein